MALAGIPFAVVGGVIALYVTGLAFSISAAIGFVSLFGVSVMNGILIITYFNQVRAGGVDAVQAMFHAADVDDCIVSVHRLAAGGDLDRHR
jgi:heavy metal efflux system protein